MKKTDLFLVIATFTYGFLFFNQFAGVNFLLFSMLMVAFSYYRNKKLLKIHHWQLAASGTLLSGIATLLYGNTYGVILNCVSLSYLGAISVAPKSSVIMAIVFSVYSYISSPLFILIDSIKRARNKTQTETKTKGLSFLYIVIACAIVILFFTVYRSSNAVYSAVTDKFLVGYFTWQWALFTLGGFLLLYGFFYHKSIKKIAEYDRNAPNNLLESKGFNSASHFKLGLLLLFLLNLLLLTVNITDFSVFFISDTLPENVTYSEMVHQGTNALILSIIMAIALIMWLFRKLFNKQKNIKALHLMAYLWIIQNLFLLFSTAYRNNLYIENYGLTHMRVGVYVYLLLAAIGLVVTFIKISKNKSNWFLVRKSSAAIFACLVLLSFFNFTNIITGYNINLANKVESKVVLDSNYLNNLPNTNLPLLVNNQTNFAANTDLHKKMYDFLYQQMYLQGWQSYNFDDKSIVDKLKNYHAHGKIDSLHITDFSVNEIKPLHIFDQLNSLSINLGNSATLSDLQKFNQLENLTLTSLNNTNKFSDSLPALPNLTTLNINGFNLNRGNSLKQYTQLTSLYVNDNALKDINFLKYMPNLKALSLGSNKIKDFTALNELKNIESLFLSYAFHIQHMHLTETLLKLETLNVSSSSINFSDSAFAKNLLKMPSLRYFNCNENALRSLYNIPHGNISELHCYNTKLKNLNGIQHLPKLQILDASGNTLDSLILPENNTVVEVNLSNCFLTNINQLMNFKALMQLNISNNRQIKNFTILAKMQGLIELHLSNTNINNVNDIAKINSLVSLNISNTHITHVEKLATLPHLTTLYMGSIKNFDYESVYNLKNLTHLYVSLYGSELEALHKAMPHVKINDKTYVEWKNKNESITLNNREYDTY